MKPYSPLHINAKHVFEEIKKENIEELRVFRQTATREAAEITQPIKQLKSNLDAKSLSEIREYVALCERLNTPKDAGSEKAPHQPARN